MECTHQTHLYHFRSVWPWKGVTGIFKNAVKLFKSCGPHSHTCTNHQGIGPSIEFAQMWKFRRNTTVLSTLGDCMDSHIIRWYVGEMLTTSAADLPFFVPTAKLEFSEWLQCLNRHLWKSSSTSAFCSFSRYDHHQLGPGLKTLLFVYLCDLMRSQVSPRSCHSSRPCRHYWLEPVDSI